MDAALARLETDRSGPRLAYAFVDVDHFKFVNDEFGHDIGDKALITVAQRVIGQLRPGDFACRFGGEEFMLILDNADEVSDVRDVLELIRTAVALPIESPGDQRANLREEAQKLSLTVSIGATIAERDEPTREALARADAAMYATAGMGGNCVKLYLPE
jgi:diguanylate cyclase (GGDEF)-like protein